MKTAKKKPAKKAQQAHVAQAFLLKGQVHQLNDRILELDIQLRQARDESARYKKIADGLMYQLEVAQKCHQVVILAFADLHKLRADQEDRLKKGQP